MSFIFEDPVLRFIKENNVRFTIGILVKAAADCSYPITCRHTLAFQD